MLTAPNQLESDDQKQLQQELQENAVLLEEGAVSAQPVITAPSEILYENPAVSSLIENQSQEEASLTFTAIGDSVMLGAVPEIQRLLPGGVIDAKEFRQIWDAASVIQDLNARGELRDIVVVALGSNGSFSKSSGQELIDALEPDCTIYWVAPFGRHLTWQESTIRILNELAEENENLTILDWPKTAAQHTDWFYDDGMHLNTEGQTGYAAFLLEQLKKSI